MSEIGYIRLHYILVFICVLQSLWIGSCFCSSLDEVLRSAMYSTAANKEMRFVDRDYYKELQRLVEKYKYE